MIPYPYFDLSSSRSVVVQEEYRLLLKVRQQPQGLNVQYRLIGIDKALFFLLPFLLYCAVRWSMIGLKESSVMTTI